MEPSYGGEDPLREPLISNKNNNNAMDDDVEDGGSPKSTVLLGSSPSHLSKRKGEYSLISPDDHDLEDDDNVVPRDIECENAEDHDNMSASAAASIASSSSTIRSRLERLLHTCLLPDDRCSICGIQLLEGPFAVKLLKFLTFTLCGIVSMYWLIRALHLEHASNLKLPDLYVYESNLIVLDAIVFFTVGRLHKQKGVDHLAWVLWALAANAFCSLEPQFKFLQHSFTLYEMHCTWPWQLWVFIATLVPLVVTVILLHVHKAVQDGILVAKIVELLLAAILFLMPLLFSSYFHFHHWFAGWLIGMHCNFDCWWSRAAMAWSWGVYINGISAWGRDPVLTCGYSYYLSEKMHCPYLDCYLDAMQHPQNDDNNNTFHPMIPPDWRNCSADSYHP